MCEFKDWHALLNLFWVKESCPCTRHEDTRGWSGGLAPLVLVHLVI